jgi:tetratricopeptide (TPR) repeat protein
MVRLVLLSCLFSFCVMSNLWGQFGQSLSRGFADASDVTVRVADAMNRPANDVRVEVLAAGTRALIASGFTTHDGVTTLPNIPNGVYEVVATKGIVMASERLEIMNTSASVNLRLSSAETGDAAGGRATVSVAQYRVPNKARKAFAKAQDAFAEHDIERAAKELAKALEIHPQFAEALTLRGILKLDAEDNDGAIDDISSAIKVDPAYATAYVALGAAFNRAQRFDEALQTLDRGVAIDPTSWQGYFEIGKAHVSKGSYELGLRSLDKAQSMSGDRYPPLHLVRAHALLALREYETAMLELQEFLKKAPQAPQSAAAREMMEKTKAFIAAR